MKSAAVRSKMCPLCAVALWPCPQLILSRYLCVLWLSVSTNHSAETASLRCFSKHCLTSWTREMCLGPRGCLWDTGGKDRGSLDLEKRQHLCYEEHCCVLWGDICCEGFYRVCDLNMCWSKNLMFSGLCLESKDTGAGSWAACLAPSTIRVEEFTSSSSLPGYDVSQFTHAFASPLTWKRMPWVAVSDDGCQYPKLHETKLTKNAWGWKMVGGFPKTSVVVITEPAQLYPSCFNGNLVCVCHRSINGIACLAFSCFQMITF